MLFLLFGSSCAGKTVALNALRGRISNLQIHDFDEIGVPSGADTAWRHRSNEVWIRRALDYEAEGRDLLLAGQTPYGELLATPSSPLLEAISACLLDCDDETRFNRLERQAPECFERTAGDLQDHLAWAEWMRRHATNPIWCPEVIRGADTEEGMQWERWRGWREGDPRWRVRIVDTSDRPMEQVADELFGWVGEERALVREGTHPLLHWAGSPRFL